MQLKKNIYYNRNDFVKHVSTIVLGRYLYDGSMAVPFLEVAEYLNTTADNLRMKKRDPLTKGMLEKQGIGIKKIRGKNHFYLESELYLVFECEVEEEKEDNILVI